MVQKKTVLVVDDEADIISIEKAILEESGYRVLSANNGLEAITLVQSETPDLILLDRTMPKMGGDETLTRLKGCPDTASIPIIFLTSLDRYGQVSGGYRLGADGYITKPFTQEQLNNGIKLVLGRRPGLSDRALHARAHQFLRACWQLASRTQELVRKCAEQECVSPSEWLYRGLEVRVKRDQSRFGKLKASPEWLYVFRGWGVDFHNSKTEEQASLAIGPGGRSDTLDAWRIQSYIETEAERGRGFTELNALIKNHSDATDRFIEYLGAQGWIEPAKADGQGAGDASIEAQLLDRWMVSAKGLQVLLAGFEAT